jgi:hypothetical protein
MHDAARPFAQSALQVMFVGDQRSGEERTERHTINQKICGKRACRNALKASSRALRYTLAATRWSTPKTSMKWALAEGRASTDAPLNILRGGAWRWPNTPQLDVETPPAASIGRMLWPQQLAGKWETVAGLAQRTENARGQATEILKWPKYG